jgi:hypothetical protein
MTVLIWRFLVFALIAAGIVWGVRRIWLEWQKSFRDSDALTRQRDLAERRRGDVITLERDKDGTFRPPEDRNPR